MEVTQLNKHVEETPKVTLKCQLWKRPSLYIINAPDGDQSKHSGNAGTDIDPIHLFDCTNVATFSAGTVNRMRYATPTSSSEVSLVRHEAMEEKMRKSSSPNGMCWSNDVLFEVQVDDHPLDAADKDDGYEMEELPTRHIQLGRGEIGKPLVQWAVKRHVSTLCLHLDEAAQHLPALLEGLLPFNTPLRHLVLLDDCYKFVSVNQLKPLLEAIRRASSLLDGVAYVYYINGSLERPDYEVEREFAKLASGFAYFGIFARSIEGPLVVDADSVMKSLAEELQREQCRLKHLRLSFWCDEIVSCLIEPALKNPNCTLARLDFRGGYGRLTSAPKVNIKPLLDAVTAPNASRITDFGLEVDNDAEMRTLVDSPLLSRIVTLRLKLEGLESSWNMLLHEGLARSSCSVQFLDCYFPFQDGDIVWRPLTKSNTSLRALKTLSLAHPRFAADLADFLRSPAASQLVYLHVTILGQEGVHQDSDEWECANALANNFSICAFGFPWNNKGAEVHAASFIKRNQMYREAQLFKEPEVKPRVAKLFLCGHPEAGKTTLGRALRSLEQRSVKCGVPSWTVCGLMSRPDRTRGMEFHSLSFPGSEMKLLVCDLAGQQEYHVFHHYFMNASSNDLFIVVCKLDDVPQHEAFQKKLDYWLRFIASHRSSRTRSLTTIDMNQAPKVIVVVNFFQENKPLDTMEDQTKRWTSTLMDKFSKVLDFGVGARSGDKYQNLFGINAWSTLGVPALGERLESLLMTLNTTARPIPQLCYKISEKLKSDIPRTNSCFTRLFGGLTRPKSEARSLTSYSEVCDMVKDEVSIAIEHKKLLAALKELHSQGSIIFFPPKEMHNIAAGKWQGNAVDHQVAGEQELMRTLVIINISWFCTDLIGSLLGTNLEGGPKPESGSPWKWPEEDVKQMLLKHLGSSGMQKHVEEILRYLQQLELCISLQEHGTESGCEAQGKYLEFPALLNVTRVSYPEFDEGSDHFYGRRLRCKNSSIHLVPFGVFTRVQVKLQSRLPAGNKSFTSGYGWASFKEGNLGVVVRFGGDDEHGSEASESKQWIDILIYCPHKKKGAGAGAGAVDHVGQFHGKPEGNASLRAANNLMNEFRNLIRAACQGGDYGGIPTVTLEECVLHSRKPESYAVPLSVILEKVKKEGLQDSYQEWAINVASTPLLDLLLPTEIEECMGACLKALASIKEEFTLDGNGGRNHVGAGEEPKPDDNVGEISGVQYSTGKGLKGEEKELHDSILSNIRAVEASLRKRLDTQFAKVNQTLGDIRADIQNLGERLQEVQRDIIADCSTRLLRNELRKDGAYPLYPYVADVRGGLAPLKAVLGKSAQVHFLCESPMGGPHPVEGQRGKEVRLEVKPWVAKAARVLVPTVRVLCCLARVAASVYLPGAHILVPVPDSLLTGLGINPDQLQNKILPDAIKAFVDGLPHDVDYTTFLKPSINSNNSDHWPTQDDLKEVMQGILQNVDMDMASDFGLHRVVNEAHCNGRPFWVCDDHLHDGTPLRPRTRNPFQF